MPQSQKRIRILPSHTQEVSDQMASDGYYKAFLVEANADPTADVTKSIITGNRRGKIQLEAMDQGVDIPHELNVPMEKGG